MVAQRPLVQQQQNNRQRIIVQAALKCKEHSIFYFINDNEDKDGDMVQPSNAVTASS